MALKPVRIIGALEFVVVRGDKLQYERVAYKSVNGFKIDILSRFELCFGKKLHNWSWGSASPCPTYQIWK